ncbi:MAG: MFS transporter [Acidobacteria bacterium]|nr:MFS transporter [Acidobacteriota bacterium]
MYRSYYQHRTTWMTVAGVPATVRVLGAAVAASALSQLSYRWGRRRTFVLGMVFFTFGAAVSAFALWTGSFLLLLVGMFVIGPARAVNQLARFAAGDMHADDRRVSAVSLIVWAATIGSVIGPRLIGRAGAMAESLGANELAGPFVMAAVGFTVAAVYYATTLRPDPMELAIAQSGVTSFVERRALRELIGVPAIQLALVTMMASQFVMVFVMVIAPVHMRANGHSLDAIGWVMMAHTLGMFGVAPITGAAIRRWGTHRVIAGAAVTLASATLVAMSAPTADMKTLVVALFLLGLGWNLGFVAGSTVIQEELMLQDRVGIQGIGDTLTALAAASGAFATGFVADWWGFRGVSAIGLVMSVVPLIALARHAKRSIDRVDQPDRSRSG